MGKLANEIRLHWTTHTLIASLFYAYLQTVTSKKSVAHWGSQLAGRIASCKWKLANKLVINMKWTKYKNTRFVLKLHRHPNLYFQGNNFLRHIGFWVWDLPFVLNEDWNLLFTLLWSRTNSDFPPNISVFTNRAGFKYQLSFLLYLSINTRAVQKHWTMHLA